MGSFTNLNSFFDKLESICQEQDQTFYHHHDACKSPYVTHTLIGGITAAQQQLKTGSGPMVIHALLGGCPVHQYNVGSNLQRDLLLGGGAFLAVLLVIVLIWYKMRG